LGIFWMMAGILGVQQIPLFCIQGPSEVVGPDWRELANYPVGLKAERPLWKVALRLKVIELPLSGGSTWIWNVLGSSERRHEIFGQYCCLFAGFAMLWKTWGIHVGLDLNKDSLSNSNIWTSKLRWTQLFWQEVSTIHSKKNLNMR
jgi:hypothetical protein